MIQGISRRSLLASGIITAGLMGLSSLAQPRSAQAETAFTAGPDGMVQTYATTSSTLPSFMVEAPAPIADDDIAATHEHEIVVVGAGISGFAAMLAAHNAGATVAVVQKQSMGVSQGTAGRGVDLDNSDPAAVESLVSLQVSSNHYRPIRSVVETWAQCSGAAMREVMDFTKDSPCPLVITKTYETPYGTDKMSTMISVSPDGTNYAGAVPQWFDYASEQGIADIFYDMPATQLIQDEAGAVTGVICQGSNGYERFNASKGVILCTGDYQNDEEMVRFFLPDMVNSTPKQNGKTGDGIKMGFWAGGVIEPMGHTKMSHDFGSGPMANEPFLYVDANGKRFCQEGIHLSLMQNFMRFQQPNGIFYQIFDSAYQDNVASWNGEIKTLEELAPYIAEDEAYKGRGQMHRANTLEELAELLQIADVEGFLATVERYNELCASGSDEDFGKDPQFMNPIATPPFYGCARNCGITAICSGLLTDGDQRVIDADGNPIPGLYAAGNTAGGFFGAIDYPFCGERIDGISVGRCYSGGYAAARHAAQRA